MTTLDGIDERIARLAKFALGLGRETAAFGAACGALPDHDQRDYLNYVMDAVAAVDAARAVLVRVRQGMDLDKPPER